MIVGNRLSEFFVFETVRGYSIEGVLWYIK